jgi:6-phosphogluconolactonase (cycloisomerase 2 family)
MRRLTLLLAMVLSACDDSIPDLCTKDSDCTPPTRCYQATFCALPAGFSLGATKAGTGSGTVASTPAGIDCGSTCASDFPYGSQVALTATPAAGSTFSGWSGDCTGSAGCTVVIDQARSVVASFALIPVALTVRRTGSGFGTVAARSNLSSIECEATCSTEFPYGSRVTLTAASATGSRFTGWTGGECSGTGDCVVTLKTPLTIQADFTGLPNADAGVPTDGGGPVDAGPSLDAGVDAGPSVDAGVDAGPSVDAGVDAGPPARELFVADSTGRVFVLDAASSGDVTAKRDFGSHTRMARASDVASTETEFFVADFGSGSVLVYDKTADGDKAPKRIIKGMWQPSGIAVSVRRREIYVADPSLGKLFVYALDAKGYATPLRTIAGLNEPLDVAVDDTGNDSTSRLIVASRGTNSLQSFHIGDQGQASPVSTIANTMYLTNFSPEQVVVDEKHAQIIAVGNDQVLGFMATDNGTNVEPQWVLDLRGFAISGIACDAVQNRLVVVSHGINRIFFYQRSSSGVPASTESSTISDSRLAHLSSIDISGSTLANERIHLLHDSSGIATFDAASDELLLNLTGPVVSPKALSLDSREIFVLDERGLVVYDDTACCANSPIRTITPRPAINYDARVDEAGNLFLLQNAYVNGSWTGQVVVFAPKASGSATPSRVISGSATTLNSPTRSAIDNSTGELYVLNVGTTSILVFPLDAAGNVAPARTIFDATSLTASGPLALDAVHKELFVGIGEKIFVYPTAASGATAPKRNITLPSNIGGLAVDGQTGELFVLYWSGATLIDVLSTEASGAATPLRSISIADMTSGIDVAFRATR